MCDHRTMFKPKRGTRLKGPFDADFGIDTGIVDDAEDLVGVGTIWKFWVSPSMTLFTILVHDPFA